MLVPRRFMRFSPVILRGFTLSRSRILFFILLFLGLLCFLDLFQPLLFKLGIALGGRALCYSLGKLGLPMGLTLAIGFLAKALITGETAPGVLENPLRMMPAGSDSVGNADSASWEKYLNPPSDSEGQVEGTEEGPTSRKRDQHTDPVEDLPHGGGESRGPPRVGYSASVRRLKALRGSGLRRSGLPLVCAMPIKHKER